MKPAQEQERISDGINLLISLLVRYPEIATIRLDPEHKGIRFTFMVRAPLTEEQIAPLRTRLSDSIDTYLLLKGQEAAIIDVAAEVYEGATLLTVFRDMATISKGEITLYITLVREYCSEQLVIDSNDALMEEDLLFQEELIDNMIENVKGIPAARGLIGIREDGRVLVFNK